MLLIGFDQNRHQTAAAVYDTATFNESSAQAQTAGACKIFSAFLNYETLMVLQIVRPLPQV